MRTLEPVEIAAFLAGVLERHGGLAEVRPDGGLQVLLGADLQAATALPESASLRVMGAAAAGELPLPLEARAVRWCLDAVSDRGRRAAVRLPGVRPRATGVAEAVQARFSAGNCAVRGADVREHACRVLLLEFRYEAVGEERADGSLYLAYEPSLRTLSAPLAAALLRELAGAMPAPVLPAAGPLADIAAAVTPHARTLLRARLEPLRGSLAGRMARDAQRLLDYHDTMLRETQARARRAPAEALAAKTAAIVRRRDEKIRELAFRYRLAVRWSLASVLEVGYQATVCDLLLLRRRREIRLSLPWDPILHEVPPRACQGCGEPALTFQACDEHGHLTCTSCTSPCARCGRSACKACHPAGCRACRAPVDTGRGAPGDLAADAE